MSTIVKMRDAGYVEAVPTTGSLPADKKSLTRKARNEHEELVIRAAINIFYTPMSEIHNL
jgi:hypothetical protein